MESQTITEERNASNSTPNQAQAHGGDANGRVAATGGDSSLHSRQHSADAHGDTVAPLPASASSASTADNKDKDKTPSTSSTASSSSAAPSKRRSVLSAHSPAFVPSFAPSPSFGSTPVLTPLASGSPTMLGKISLSNYAPPSPVVLAESGSPSMSSLSITSSPKLLDLNSRIKAIQSQAEFYFSNSNLWKDQFLREEIAKDPEGFVSVSLISDFKRIRKLSKDVTLLVCALRQSNELVVSEDGTRVRRRTPLPPPNPKEERKRTIHVSGLPLHADIELVSSVFSDFGKVCLVQLLGEDARAPGSLHAFVEFETPAQAKLALKANRMQFPVQSKAQYQKASKNGVSMSMSMSGSPLVSSSSPGLKGKAGNAAAKKKPNTRDFMNWRLEASSSSSALSAAGAGPGASTSADSPPSSSLGWDVIDAPAASAPVTALGHLQGMHRHSFSKPSDPSSSSFMSFSSSSMSSSSSSFFLSSTSGASTSPGAEATGTGAEGINFRRPHKFSAGNGTMRKAVVRVRMAKGPDGTRGFANRTRPAGEAEQPQIVR